MSGPRARRTDLEGSGESAPEPSVSDPADLGDLSARERARLRARVFGDVLPESTRDDRPAGGAEGLPDDWYRGEVPPHHG